MKETYLTTESERAYRKMYYEKNREKKIEYQRKYRARKKAEKLLSREVES